MSPIRSEKELYFPGLYGGKLSTGRMEPSADIKAETEKDPERKRLYETAKEFQSIFVNLMMKSMRSTLNKEDDLLYGGNKQDIFEDMLYNEYSKALSAAPGFNLADKIYLELERSLPSAEEGKKIISEYESNMRRIDGIIDSGKRKQPFQWDM